MEICKKVLLLLAVLLPFVTSAQLRAVLTVGGEYQKTFSENVSIREAKIALESYAREQLIAEEFGTSIYSNSTTSISNIDGKSSTKYDKNSISELGGEWLETIGEPQFSKPVWNEEMTEYTLRIEIKGKIREIKSARVDFTARILRNGVEDDHFVSGDKFYLEFTAPCSGHLSVYLQDEEGWVYYLSPYTTTMEHDYVDISPREKTMFYDRKDGESSTKRGWHMTCGQTIAEHDKIYIIFSPNIYYDPDYEVYKSGRQYGHRIRMEDFKVWLARIHSQDVKMRVEERDIVVEPKK